jgi:uncharacterized protein (TIGR03437 family)
LNHLFRMTALCCAAIAQPYVISTYAGGGPPGTVSNFSALGSINAVAADSAGNLFLSLPDYHMVVRRDASTGLLTIVAGTGTAGYTGDNGPAADAQLTYPDGLAFDAAGNLYIADGTNNVVREVSNGIITTIAGTGKSGFSGDGGPATSAMLSQPHGIAVDASSNLYIADSGNSRIREVSNGTITTIAGNGNEVPPATVISGALATSSPLLLPMGVAIDANGDVYISDYIQPNILKISGGIITIVATAVPAATGIAVDSKGNLFVAVSANSTMDMISNGVVTVIAGDDIAGFSGDGGLAIDARLNDPLGVAVDASGNIYIADSKNMRVRRVSAGIITTIVGAGAGGLAGDGGPPANAQLFAPSAIAQDSSGNLYIADTGNNVVRKVSGGIITTIAGNGVAGYTGDGGPATSAQLRAPAGVTVDAAGNLFIADTGNGVIRKVSNGIITTFSSSISPASPSAITIDASGNLYVVATAACEVLFPGLMLSGTTSPILKISNGVVTTIAPGFCSANQPLAVGLAVDSSGNLFHTQGSSVYKLENGVSNLIAGAGTGFGGDNGPAISAQLSAPSGLAVDSSGALWISDTGNQRIRKVSNGIITTIAGTGPPTLQGFPTFAGDGGPALAAQLDNPEGMVVSPAGQLFFADTGNNRIRLLTPTGGCFTTVSINSTQMVSIGGNLAVTIQTAASCAWSVSNLPSWITATPASGTGPATVTLAIAVNFGPQHLASFTVGTQSFTVTQAAATYTITGRVTLNGQPLAGVLISLGTNLGFATTGADGSYLLIFSSFGGFVALNASAVAYDFLPATTMLFGNGDSVVNFTAWPKPQIASVTPYFVSTLQSVSTTLAPREIVTIHGTLLCVSTASASPPLAKQLGGCGVSLNGAPLVLYSAAPDQITAVLPQLPQSGISGLIVSRYTDASANQLAAQNGSYATLAPVAMAFLERSDNGTTLLAAQYTDGSFAGSQRPLAPGDTVILYLTGLGLTTPTFPDGIAPNTSSQAAAQIEITVEGLSAQILYAGLQPQYPGFDQIVLQLPQYTLPAGQTTANFVITAPSAGQTLHYSINSQ